MKVGESPFSQWRFPGVTGIRDRAKSTKVFIYPHVIINGLYGDDGKGHGGGVFDGQCGGGAGHGITIRESYKLVEGNDDVFAMDSILHVAGIMYRRLGPLEADRVLTASGVGCGGGAKHEPERGIRPVEVSMHEFHQ
jgi:hypothetical protein